MTKQNIIAILKKYQKGPERKRREYLRMIEKSMIYETTKCEHPDLTIKTVEKVLHKLTH